MASGSIERRREWEAAERARVAEEKLHARIAELEAAQADLIAALKSWACERHPWRVLRLR